MDSPAAGTPAQRAETARRLARERGTAVLLSGAEDLVSDGDSLWKISGGSPRTAQITAAFWKACAHRAEALAGERGPGSFRAALLDAAGTLTAKDCARETQRL